MRGRLIVRQRFAGIATLLSLLGATAHAQPAEEALSAPRVVESVDPEYPPDELPSGRTPTVTLHVTVDAEGRVREAHVDDTAGEQFDAAALAAVRQWRFEPARRAGRAIASRIRVEVRFSLPDFDLPAQAVDAVEGEEPPPPQTAPPETAPPEPPIDDAEPELEVEARLEREHDDHARSASQHDVDRDVLEAAPRRDGGDLLQCVPGLFAARGEGDAVGQRLMLRGFDADHGQDIELTLEGVPINLPSHIHGQGYADLGFLLPEVVRALSATEGVYDPSQGDFAVAGSIDLRLGVRERGVTSRTSYGRFNTFRQLLLWAPADLEEGTFGAAAYRRTDGYGRGRAGESGSAMVSYAFEGDRSWRGRIFALGYGARASLAGVVRADDIEAGNVGFYGRYDDPVAENQSALAVRVLLGGTLEHRGERGQRTSATLWASYDDFRIQEAFTGYLERSRTMPEWSGRGDLIEQQNETFSLGFSARHRSAHARLFDWLRGSIAVGLAARADMIEQRQALLAAPQNETWDERVDASITGADVGAWLDLDVHVTDYVRVRGGVRGDLLFYDVDDRLGNFIPAFRRESYIIGFRRSAFGFAAGPRASIEVRPIEPLSLMIAYGEGYRSPQARQLVDGERAPFTKVRSGDLGFRLELGDHRELELAGTAFYTHLSDDIAFDAHEGRLEPVGPTSRAGASLALRTEPFAWLTAALSITFVHATLDEPPPVSAADPTPAFTPGSLLPFVAPWVVRADVGAHEELFELDGHPVLGRAGIGFSFLSPRPLPFGQEADPVALLDASISASWRWLTIGVEAFNITGSRWSANELFFVSNWRPSEQPSRLPARHIAAGQPFSILATLGVTL